jgi:branched-chain amino acid transport system ATP-binding protein
VTLIVDRLTATYQLAQVLDGVSLEIPSGAIVSILGRNGMGKTSLCRCIMGLAPPQISSGSIRYGDTSLVGRPPHDIARAGLGYVPQGRHIFPSLDVVENLTMAARAPTNGEGWTLDAVWEMFPRLAERKNQGAGQLSGGEQQMLAIARALMTNPGLVVMDEPSEGLAPVVVESLAERLQKLKGSDLSMLLVEQNLGLAMSLADLVYVMEKGRIVFQGGPEELEASDDVKRRYLGVGV